MINNKQQVQSSWSTNFHRITRTSVAPVAFVTILLLLCCSPALSATWHENFWPPNNSFSPPGLANNANNGWLDHNYAPASAVAPNRYQSSWTRSNTNSPRSLYSYTVNTINRMQPLPLPPFGFVNTWPGVFAPEARFSNGPVVTVPSLRPPTVRRQNRNQPSRHRTRGHLEPTQPPVNDRVASASSEELAPVVEESFQPSPVSSPESSSSSSSYSLPSSPVSSDSPPSRASSVASPSASPPSAVNSFSRPSSSSIGSSPYRWPTRPGSRPASSRLAPSTPAPPSPALNPAVNDADIGFDAPVGTGRGSDSSSLAGPTVNSSESLPSSA